MRTENNTIYNLDRILKYEVEFYKTLCKSCAADSHEIESYLNNSPFAHTLSDNDANLCEGNISLNELNDALNSMKLNKSPGLDGLSVEFFKTFWTKISPLLFNCILECSASGELSRSQKQCIFSLLYKKGDPENLENWRPIKLLRTDYK